MPSLIAIRAERAQVFELRLSFLAVRQDVIDVKSNLSVRIVRTGIAGSCTAKNTCVAVAFKHCNPKFWGNSFSGGKPLKRFEDIFPRLEIVAIHVGPNLHAFFVPKFAHSAGMRDDPGDLGYLFAGYDFADIRRVPVWDLRDLSRWRFSGHEP